MKITSQKTMNHQNKMRQKINETKNRAEFIILLLSAFMLLSTIAFAIPNTLTLQGKLTNLADITKVLL